MIVFDSGHFFWNWDVEVTGLDVDQARWKGEEGRLPHNSFRCLAPELKARHFVAGARPPGQGADPPPGELPAWQSRGARELRGPGAARRHLLPQRAHLLLGRDDPSAVRIFRNILAPGRIPLPRATPKSLSRITDLLPARALPGRDGLPRRGGSAGLPAVALAAPHGEDGR